MDLQLTGKRALVTGSTAGIGLAIAKALAMEGVAVVVNGRTAARVEAAVSTLRMAAPEAAAIGIAADLSTAEGAELLVAQLPDVDILVNNLGIYEPKPFAEATDELWKRTFDVNVLSGVRLCRAYLPPMFERNWGRVVFISSESAVNIPAEMIHYGMTKTAQLAVARGLAETTAGTGVTVNSVLPGPTWSEGASQFVESMARANKKTVQEQEADFFKELRPSSLLRRFATVDEVAAMVAYVCSVQAAATNGAALRVEGGLLRSIL